MPRHAGALYGLLPPRALAGGLHGGSVAVLEREEEMGGAEGQVRPRPVVRRAVRFRQRWGGIGGGGGRAAAAAVRPQPRRRARRVRLRSLHQPAGEPLVPLMTYPFSSTSCALPFKLVVGRGGKRHGLAYVARLVVVFGRQMWAGARPMQRTVRQCSYPSELCCGLAAMPLTNRTEITECAVAATGNVLNDAATIAACFSVKYMMES